MNPGRARCEEGPLEISVGLFGGPFQEGMSYFVASRRPSEEVLAAKRARRTRLRVTSPTVATIMVNYCILTRVGELWIRLYDPLDRPVSHWARIPWER